MAADLQRAGQPAVVDFGSKQVGSPRPVAAVARLGQATARAVAEAVGCLGPAAEAAAGVGLAVAVGGAAVGAEAGAVGLDRAVEGAAAVGLDLVAAGAVAVAPAAAVGLGPVAAAAAAAAQAEAEAEAAELAAAAGFDHDVTPGSCQARLPLRAIRLQREVAAAAAGPGEGTTSGGASPWLGARAGA